MTFKDRRCRWFDDNGLPYSQQGSSFGCPRTRDQCHFAHPQDPEWATAAKSRPPPSERPKVAPHQRSRSRTPPPRERRLSDSLSMDRVRDDRARHSERERSPARSSASVDSRMRDARDDRRDPPRTPTLSSMPPPSQPTRRTSDQKAGPPLTYQQQRDVWVDRIKSLSDAVLARAEYLKLQKDEHNYKRLVQSTRFSVLPDEDKANMYAKLKDVGYQLEERKRRLNSSLTKLIDSDYWPLIHPIPAPPVTSVDPTTIEELKSDVQSLRAELQSLRAETDKAMQEIGSTKTECPPAKRRRLDPVPAGDDQKTGAGAPGRLEITEKLDALEQRVDDLADQLLQQDSDLRCELDVIREDQPGQASVFSSASPAKIEQIEKEVRQADNDLSQLANEVAGMIVQHSQIEAYHKNLAKQNALLKDEIASMKEANAQMKEELKALNEAIATALSDIGTPRPQHLTPPQLDLEKVIGAIVPVVLESIQTDIMPVLQSTQANMNKLLQDQSSEIYTAVVSKMSPTITAVDVISRWFESLGAGGRQLPPKG